VSRHSTDRPGTQPRAARRRETRSRHQRRVKRIFALTRATDLEQMDRAGRWRSTDASGGRVHAGSVEATFPALYPNRPCLRAVWPTPRSAAGSGCARRVRSLADGSARRSPSGSATRSRRIRPALAFPCCRELRSVKARGEMGHWHQLYVVILPAMDSWWSVRAQNRAHGSGHATCDMNVRPRRSRAPPKLFRRDYP